MTHSRRWAGLTRALTPLAINLAIAVVLRVLLPVTLEDSGERYRYYSMSLFLPLRNCPSFHCFRILPPLLAGLLPFQIADNFIVVGFVFQVLTGTMLWYVSELLHPSRRVALFAVGWFWATLGPIQSFGDPLLITDPVQSFWSLTALFLLLSRQYALALPVLISGAFVKESVLLVPMIYSAYAIVADAEARRRPVWLALLIGAPLLTWILLRAVLTSRFGYVSYEDESYVRLPYFFGTWLPNLAAWPKNLIVAALYIYGSCGAAWLLAPLGLRRAGRRQLFLSLVSIPPMVFLALYQIPDRALANFPYATLVPAAVLSSQFPTPLGVALLLANAVFSIRMNTSATWVPRLPVSIAVTAVLLALAGWQYLAGRQAEDGPSDDRAPVGAWARRAGWAGVTIAIACVAAVVTLQAERSRAQPHAREWDVRVAPAVVDDDAGAPAFAVSPDGAQIAFVAVGVSGGHTAVRRLWTRRADGGDAKALAGTDRANGPFFSPDGAALGFFADGKLKTVRLADGAVTILADAPLARGGTWGSHGDIVFASDVAGVLSRVAERGGPVTSATSLDARRREWSHRWPAFLPDGTHFIFLAKAEKVDDSWLHVASVDATERRPFSPDRSNPEVGGPDFVLTVRGADLGVRPLDPTRAQAFGDWMPMTGVVLAAASNRAAVAASDRTLVFSPRREEAQTAEGSQLVWIDRDGRVRERVGEPGTFSGVELAPDGRSASIQRTDGTWIWRGGEDHTLRMFHADAAEQPAPIWSRDGRQLLVSSMSGAAWQPLAIDPLGRAAPIVTLVPGHVSPTSVSPDGRVVLLQAPNPVAWNILAATREGPPHTISTDPYDGHDWYQAQFSPDGKWIAFTSTVSGVEEVYVQPYPSTGERWRVSVDGGAQPRWRADGREIVYVTDDQFFRSVSISTEPAFHPGLPRPLFEQALRPPSRATRAAQYAMTPDGGRFLVNAAASAAHSATTVISEWKAGLR